MNRQKTGRASGAIALLVAFTLAAQAQTTKPNQFGEPTYSRPVEGQLITMQSAPQTGLLASLEAVKTSEGKWTISCRVWNEEGVPQWESVIPGNQIHAMAFGRQGKILAIGGVGTLPWMRQRRSEVTDRGTVRVFDAKTGKLWRSFPVRRNGLIHAIAVAPKAPILAVAGNNWIDIWDYSRQRQIATLPMGYCKEVSSLSFSPDGKWLANNALQELPSIWRVANWKKSLVLNNQAGGSSQVLFSPSSQSIALGGQEFVCSYNLQGKLLWQSKRDIGLNASYHDANSSMSYSRDGQWLLTTGSRNFIFNPKGEILGQYPNYSSLRFGQNSVWGVQKSMSITTGNTPLRVGTLP